MSTQVECAKMQNQRSRANGAKRVSRGGGGSFGDGAVSSSVPVGVGFPNADSPSAEQIMINSITDAMDDFGMASKKLQILQA